MSNKVFLIIDGTPSTTFIQSIDELKQIDSVFVYSPSADSISGFSYRTEHTYLVYWCENDATLIDRIQKSREELEKQTVVFSIYNKKEKATRDVSKDVGSFLFLQLFKTVIQNMPRTNEAKKSMLTICRSYYRRNLNELANIDDFDRNYVSHDAIKWYVRESFIYK